MRGFAVPIVLLTGTAILLAPVAMKADVCDGHHERRYDDKNGRGYHAWNDDEDRAYRIYLEQQHRTYREFGRMNAARQQEYFRWRHNHPDNVMFKVEIR